MIFEALILGIIIGKIRGGKIKRLGYSTLQLPFILLCSFILILGTSILNSLGHPVAIAYRMPLYIVAYVLLFLVLFFNLHQRSLWFVMIGAILNFAAIVLNQGSMPVDLALLEAHGFNNMLQSMKINALPHYISLEVAHPLTQYLGKIIATPSFYPLKQILSVGDLLISLGLLLYVQHVIHSRNYPRAEVIRFDYQTGIKE